MTEQQRNERRRLVADLAAYFQGYLHCCDPAYPLVLAVWAVGTWAFDRFYSFPYLVVNGRTKGAGKTRVLELLKGVVRRPVMAVNPSLPAIYRMIAASQGHVTILWDEAEVTASSNRKSQASEILNSGYRRGQTVPRTAPGGQGVVEYATYCPKVFGMIGSPGDTLSDRSILVTMERGTAPREYLPEVAEGEARTLQAEIVRVLSSGAADVAAAPPLFLQARAREVWAPLFGVAAWLGLDAATLDVLTRFAVDSQERKGLPVVAAYDPAEEDRARDAAYAVTLRRDLGRVLDGREKRIATVELLGRLAALPDGPWRAFRGVGLDAVRLAALLEVAHGPAPKLIRQGKTVSRGYDVPALLAVAAGQGV